MAKPIWYSVHAQGRMVARGITRADVRWLLHRGTRTELGGSVFERRGYIKRGEAAVIYHEDAERLLVITVEWIE